MPFISVIVPTHNRPDMLAEALTSVRAQTFIDYEIIVVSNGESTEMSRQTRSVVALHDACWFALPEGNLLAARNFGIIQATGNWIAFLDDDDIWLPEKLDRQIEPVRSSGADVITCDQIRFFPDGSEGIDRLRFPEGWSWRKSISCHHWGARHHVQWSARLQ